MVAVAPAVDGALNEAALFAQVGVELCQRPADGVALALVMQSIALVLVLATAGARIDAVVGLELGAQPFHIDGLDVAADGVFHLDAVA